MNLLNDENVVVIKLFLEECMSLVEVRERTNDYEGIESKKMSEISVDIIKKAVLSITKKYPISKIDLFGSRAAGTNRYDSDIDLIMEFNAPITLIILSQIKYDMEDELGVTVDIIHGPINDNDMIELGEVVELYAA
jgi:hypothetical protein